MKVSVKDIVDIRHSFEYYKSDSSQLLILNLPNTLKIKITVADSVFEWFVDVYNSTGDKLISNWYDHYDNDDSTLIEEMKESIVELVNDVTNNKTRIIVEKKFLTEKTSFQILKGDNWTDYFHNSKLKL
jgi:hypothetical protein